nr:MAG TPA: hypothetical protein [Caudoviricetes sp.]
MCLYCFYKIGGFYKLRECGEYVVWQKRMKI